MGKTIDLTKPVERIDDSKGVVVKIGTTKRMMYSDGFPVAASWSDEATQIQE